MVSIDAQISVHCWQQWSSPWHVLVRCGILTGIWHQVDDNENNRTRSMVFSTSHLLDGGNYANQIYQHKVCLNHLLGTYFMLLHLLLWHIVACNDNLLWCSSNFSYLIAQYAIYSWYIAVRCNQKWHAAHSEHRKATHILYSWASCEVYFMIGAGEIHREMLWIQNQPLPKVHYSQLTFVCVIKLANMFH